MVGVIFRRILWTDAICIVIPAGKVQDFLKSFYSIQQKRDYGFSSWGFYLAGKSFQKRLKKKAGDFIKKRD